MIKKYQNLVENNFKNDIIYLRYKCPHCGKLLFKYKNDNNIENIEIKCGRCKNIIIIENK